MFKKSRLPFKDFNYLELSKISFGDLEGENDSVLRDSLVLTKSIKKLLNSKINYVLSPKGAGKSAIFKAFQDKLFEKFDFNKNCFLFINEAFTYQNNYLDPSKFKYNSEDKNYIFAWAIYIAVKIIYKIKRDYEGNQYYSSLISKIKDFADLKEELDLYSIFDYIKNANISCAFVVSGQQFTIAPKLNINKARKQINLNDIFNYINEFFKCNDLTCYILIDRIDNFVRNEEYRSQKKYIQGLISSIEEIKQLTNINPILFLRTDLYLNLKFAFEYDKTKARTLHLKWTKTEVLNFLVRRFLSNKYINENYFEYIRHLFVKEFNTTKKLKYNIKVIYYKITHNLKKLNFDKDFDYKIFESFLKLFLPIEVNHLDENNEIKAIDLFDWLFTHFIDRNGYINPRCLIYFFNKLAEIQLNTYTVNYNLAHNNFNLILKEDSGLFHLDLFTQNAIQETYTLIQKEELLGIYSLLSEKYEKSIFLRITEICYEKGFFKYSDIDFRRFGATKDGYDSLIRYLEIIGFFGKDENHSNTFSIPIIFRQKIDVR